MSDDLLARLAAHFAPNLVSWRIGVTNKEKTKGMALAYLDSRDVQDRLNEVCGLNWQVRHPWSAGSKLACEIGIKIGGEWIWRGDGAGDSDVEAEKGAFSDSFKRAAVRWGIGRYLYDIDSPWVQIEGRGNSYVIAQGEIGKLRDLLFRIGKSATSSGDAPPSTETDWNAVAYEIRSGIDGATTAGALAEILEGRNFLDLEKHSKTASQFLRDRANKKAASLAQAPQGKAA